ncbi:MAG: hypothetical protein Q9182_005358 [Xanthomendoza sp. 2 TL-2023]
MFWTKCVVKHLRTDQRRNDVQHAYREIRSWVAKLCDFGSAVPSQTGSQNNRYLGSDTWLPPECYENIRVGKAMPVSLIPCDIFVYGLVVWATFIGTPFSPIHHIQHIEGHGDDIVRNIGRQQFYARAVQSVTAKYSMARSNIHRLLAELTGETFSHFSGSAERAVRERRQSRNTRDRPM